MTWVNPVKIHLRCFYSVVIANSKLDFFCICLRPRRPCLLPFGAHGKSALHSVFCVLPITPCALCCTADSGTYGQGNGILPCMTQMTLFFCSLWWLLKSPVLMLFSTLSVFCNLDFMSPCALHRIRKFTRFLLNLSKWYIWVFSYTIIH